jgi:hypothetical protein
LRSLKNPNNTFFSPRVRARALQWTDLAIFPLVLVLSIPPLLWFGRNWAETPDASWYLLRGWILISGVDPTDLSVRDIARGPVFSGLLGGLMLLFGRDVESLAWMVRLLALANPVLMYFLMKRIAGAMTGLLAAAMVALFSLTATLWHAFSIDAVRLTVFLLAVLVLLAGARRDSAGLSLLSGLLLGAAMLTKETSLVFLPLALFAALLLGWSFRGVLLHYIGVLVVCLPWWWQVGLQVWWAWLFFLGRSSPFGLVALVIAAFALIALFVAGSYRSGVAARLLADERWRQRIGWFVGLASIAILSVLALKLRSSTALSLGQPPPERSNSGEVLLRYAASLRDDISLWYLLPFAGVYLVWETVRGNRLWGFYSALLILQIPFLLLVMLQGLETRQWLIAQTLLYGALAGLMAKVLGALIREERHNLRRSLAFGAATVLIIALVWGTVSQVRYLLFNDVNLGDANGNDVNIQDHQLNEDNPAVRDMYSWIAENIPEGEKIIVTPRYDVQLAFLDGMQYEWTPLQVDCEAGPHPYNNDVRCVRSKLIAQAPPQPTVWFKEDENCNGVALSLTTLMRQMERSGSKYLLTTQQSGSFYPSNLAWAPYIDRSGAFEPVHSSYLPGAPTEDKSYGLVLLRWTGQGQNPTPAPTQMDVDSVARLLNCEQAAWGEQYAEKIRSAFPNGIEIMGGSDPSLDLEVYRGTIENIYKKPQ